MERFMAKSKGPAKQFLALVGDKNELIKEQLKEKLLCVDGETDCYYFETYYYSAKFAMKLFNTLADVRADHAMNKNQMMCIFVAYESLDQLKEAKIVADEIKADTRVVIIQSLDSCPEAEQIEQFASQNEFEVVYLMPNEEQLNEAKELSEKVGVGRLIETLEVCNWPWRVCNASSRSLQGMLTTFMSNSSAELTEHEIGEDGVMGGPAAESFARNYIDWYNRNPDARIPAPQHAERVHLSPDSPTTTEGTTNPDDVSISVDIDLVCTKTQENESHRTHS
uniref:Zeta_toxin domain-containing protein n=1 Tax=Caenorhabditis tropicalis TaxID=1561998 RepID=A0A1I7TKR1_9PELO